VDLLSKNLRLHVPYVDEHAVAGGPRMTTAFSSGEACTVTPSRVKLAGRALVAPAPG
jgi:hypothetical protein